MVWYSHLFQNFPQFMVIHTVKGFGIVNKAERDNFLELSCFFDDPIDVDNLISGSSAFSKSSLNIWKFMVYSPWNSPGQNTGVGSLCLPQWIFPTQKSNWSLLHCRQLLYQLSYQGKTTHRHSFPKCFAVV